MTTREHISSNALGPLSSHPEFLRKYSYIGDRKKEVQEFYILSFSLLPPSSRCDGANKQLGMTYKKTECQQSAIPQILMRYINVRKCCGTANTIISQPIDIEEHNFTINRCTCPTNICAKIVSKQITGEKKSSFHLKINEFQEVIRITRIHADDNQCTLTVISRFFSFQKPDNRSTIEIVKCIVDRRNFRLYVKATSASA